MHEYTLLSLSLSLSLSPSLSFSLFLSLSKRKQVSCTVNFPCILRFFCILSSEFAYDVQRLPFYLPLVISGCFSVALSHCATMHQSNLHVQLQNPTRGRQVSSIEEGPTRTQKVPARASECPARVQPPQPPPSHQGCRAAWPPATHLRPLTHMLVTLSLWLVTAMYIDSGAPQPRRGHMEPV